MNKNIAQELTALQNMSMDELQEKYRQVFGEEPRIRHKDFLRKRIAWRIQALAEGDLSERARSRVEELANDADLRIRSPKVIAGLTKTSSKGQTTVHTFTPSHDKRLPMPGAMLTKDYQGKMIKVMVLDKGFEYEGQIYRSLTAVAKAVTGSHWNGFLFFGLRGKRG